LITSGSLETSYTRAYHCCYASRKNRYTYRYTHAQIVEAYGDWIVQVASVPGVFSSALGDEGYMFRSPDLEQIKEITAFVQASAEG